MLTILTTLLVAGKTTTLLEGLSYYVVPETEAERAGADRRGGEEALLRPGSKTAPAQARGLWRSSARRGLIAACA